MQDDQTLNVTDRELLNSACAHIRERYRKDFTTIAGALRTKSGKIYTGINLRYRIGNEQACGEAMAIYNALNDGESDFDTLVGVKYRAGTDTFEVVNACGWCRQLFSYNTPLKIILDNNGKLEVREAKGLLPLPFI